MAAGSLKSPRGNCHAPRGGGSDEVDLGSSLVVGTTVCYASLVCVGEVVVGVRSKGHHLAPVRHLSCDGERIAVAMALAATGREARPSRFRRRFASMFGTPATGPSWSHPRVPRRSRSVRLSSPQFGRDRARGVGHRTNRVLGSVGRRAGWRLLTPLPTYDARHGRMAVPRLPSVTVVLEVADLERAIELIEMFRGSTCTSRIPRESSVVATIAGSSAVMLRYWTDGAFLHFALYESQARAVRCAGELRSTTSSARNLTDRRRGRGAPCTGRNVGVRAVSRLRRDVWS